MSQVVGILDVNFFEGQARQRGNPEILGENPYVVANYNSDKIYSLNESAKNYGLNRSYTLSEAMASVPNLSVIQVPLNNRGSPIRQDLHNTSRDFFLCVQSIRDENNWNISIEHSYPDEALLDLSEEVDDFMSCNSQPFIASKSLHWNSYFENDERLLMSDLEKFGQNKRYLSRNHPEAYYSALIMTTFMRGLKNSEDLQVSAGIGKDRFHAKLASQIKDESNSLTYLDSDGFDRVAQYLDINRIVGLKGRIGQDIKNSFGIETVAELRSIPFSQLNCALGGNSNKTREIRHKIFGNLPNSYKDNWPIKNMVID